MSVTLSREICPQLNELPLQTSIIFKKTLDVKSPTITKKDIAWLWMMMTKAYGHKFVSNFGSQDNGVWFETLADLTKADLTYGFLKLMRHINGAELSSHESWPPNLKEFRSYCIRQYTDFGLMKPSVAFKEVENNRYISWVEWSHPLVCCAAEEVNGLDYHDNPLQLYASFIAVYKNECDRYMRGEKILVSERILNNRYRREIPNLLLSCVGDQKFIHYKLESLQ